MSVSGVTDIGIVENAGPNQMTRFLNAELRKARGADIAVAFITQSGLKQILTAVRKASLIGPVRVLTGLFNRVTEPAALRTLLRETKETGGRIAVKLSSDRHFHWKAYVMRGPKTSRVIIGSSNLTSDGLTASGELNVTYRAPTQGTAVAQVSSAFEQAWADGVELSPERVRRYAKFRAKVGAPPTTHVPLELILGSGRGTKVVESLAAPTVGETQYWRDSFDGYTDNATNEVVEETTGWDARGYSFYSSREPRHRKGDLILIFDFNERRVRQLKVMDRTRTPTRTPDGRDFTAYVKLRGSRERVISAKFWRTVRKRGVVHTKEDAKGPQKLSRRQWDELLDKVMKP